MKPIEVHLDQAFNRWKVIDPTPITKRYGTAHAGGKGRPVRSFLCRCECGTQRIVRGDYLHRGTSKSCGCLRVEVARKKGKRQKTKISYHNGIFYATKASAKNRNLTFELSAEQHLNLIIQDCFYCGAAPEAPKTKLAQNIGIPFPHHGVDRKDSSLGYLPSNCVSCCARCNFMKMAMPVQEFVLHCAKIVRHCNATVKQPFSIAEAAFNEMP